MVKITFPMRMKGGHVLQAETENQIVSDAIKDINAIIERFSEKPLTLEPGSTITFCKVN